MADAKAIEDAVRASLSRRMDERLMTAIGAGTSTISSQDMPPLDAKKMMTEWAKIIRNARRTAVVFVVELGHPGAPLRIESATEGTRIELSPWQAQMIHQQWPMKLWKIVSEDVAEFVPVSGVFPEYVPRVIPMPPYETPVNFRDHE